MPNGKMILLGVIIPPDLCRRVPERRRAHPPLCHPDRPPVMTAKHSGVSLIIIILAIIPYATID